MPKPLVPADLLKQVQAADKPVSAASAGKPKADAHPKPAVKVSARPQAKTGVAHTRMSSRGK